MFPHEVQQQAVSLSIVEYIPIGLSCLAIAISVWGYFYHHKRARFDIMEQSFDALQRINEKALDSDLNLLAAIQSGNPLDRTGEDEARLIYFYYMRINRVFRAYEYRRGKFINQRQADRIMQPAIGTLKGALPKIDAILSRGYPEDFIVWLKKRIENADAPKLISSDSEREDELSAVANNSNLTGRERKEALNELIELQSLNTEHEAVKENVKVEK